MENRNIWKRVEQTPHDREYTRSTEWQRNGRTQKLQAHVWRPLGYSPYCSWKWKVCFNGREIDHGYWRWLIGAKCIAGRVLDFHVQQERDGGGPLKPSFLNEAWLREEQRRLRATEKSSM
jgi:hypothetical protein